MIKLKNILNEEKKFKARSAETGKIVYYKTKDNLDKALDAGEAEPIEKGTKKAGDGDGKVKGADLFKSKETGKSKYADDDIARNYEDDDTVYSPENPHPMAGIKSGNKVVGWDGEWTKKGKEKKAKADFDGDYGKAADYSDKLDKELGPFMPKPPTDDGGWTEPEAETSFDDFDEDGNAIYTMYIEDPANDNYYDKQLKVDKKTGEVSEVPGSDTSVPDYDGAKFDFDRIFPEDDESIKAFQDIEDNGTVEDMEDYISSYADEELLQRYGIRKPEQIKKLAQKVMAKKVSSTKIDPDDDKAVISFIDKEGKFGPKGAKASVSAWVAKRYGKLDKNNSAYLAWKKMTEGKLTEAKVMGKSSSSKLTDIISEKSKGLWANIHARRKSGKRMRKKGEKGAPSDKNFRSASENIKAGYEVRKEDYDCFMEYLQEQMQNITEAEYQGRKVKLNKPTRGDSGKFKVYVKNPKGNVVKVNFGAKGKKNRIKKSDPGARASFRARHNCDSPGPKHKARYWSCKNW